MPFFKRNGEETDAVSVECPAPGRFRYYLSPSDTSNRIRKVGGKNNIDRLCVRVTTSRSASDVRKVQNGDQLMEIRHERNGRRL